MTAYPGKWKDESGDSRIERAERAVNSSLNRLENAMESLTEKMENTGQKLRHVMDLGSRQKEEIGRLKHQTLNTLQPIVESGRNISQRVYSKARSDPRPFLLGAMVIAGGLLYWSWKSRSRRPGSAEIFTESTEEPDTWAV